MIDKEKFLSEIEDLYKSGDYGFKEHETSFAIADYVLKREAIAELRGMKNAAGSVKETSLDAYAESHCNLIIADCDAKLAELEKE